MPRIELTIASPNDVSETELTEFCEMVRAGGAVMSEGLEGRVQQAKSLVFLRVDKQLAGVAAIKQYRAGVFRNAGVQEDAQFQSELGYIAVNCEHRRRGYSYLLSVVAMSQTDRKPTYATVGQDNTHMRKPLERLGFKCVGEPWYSTIKKNKYLVLYVNTS